MNDPGKAVFLSYASQDAAAAKKICDALRAAGVEVWFDQSELVGGDAWDAKIRKQIAGCALFVPIISANTQARAEGYFRLEWKLADRRTDLIGKSKAFLLPVSIDDTRDSDADVPDSFLAVQWTRLKSGETSPAFVARVKKLLEGEMEAGRPRPAERGEGAPPPDTKRPPRIGLWLALGAAAVVALVLAVSRPWQHADTPGSKAASAAPLSEARQLAGKAQNLIKPGATRTELEAADKLCAKAANLDPADAEVLATWSQVCSWFTFHNFDPDLERKDAAKTRADQALELDPKSFEARFAQAFYLTPLIGGRPGSAEDAEAADRIQQQLLRERPDEPRVLLALGIRQGRSFHIEEARATFERLVKNPAYAAAGWGELGWAEMLSSNYAAAVAAVDRANGIQPLWRNLVLKALLAMEWHGDIEGALAMEKRMPAGVTDLGVLGAYIRLAGRDPQGTLQSIGSMSRNWLRTGGYEGPKAVWTALAYEQLHEKDRAEAEWQFALKLIQDHLTAEPTSGLRRLEAFVLASLDRPADAEKALRLAPDAADYLRGPWLTRNRYVLTQVRLGHSETVMDYLEKDPRLTAAVLRIEPELDPLRGLPRFQALLAKLEADPGRSPSRSSVSLAEKPAAAVLSPARALVAKAVPLFDNLDAATRADMELAGEMFKQAFELAPLDAEVWANYSWYCSNVYSLTFDKSKEREAEIKRAADKAMKLDPNSDMARFAWANYYRRQQAMLDEVTRVLQELVKGSSENKKVFLRSLAIAVRASTGPEEALKILDQAIALPGGDAHAWLGKADIYWALNRRAEAEAALDRSLATKSTPRVLCRKAIFLVEQHDDLAGAEKILRQLPGEFLQEDRPVSAAITLAFYQRKPERCLEVLAAFPRDFIEEDNYRAALTGPKSLYAGYAHWMQGKTELARLEWEEALKLVDQRLQARRTDVSLNRLKMDLLALLGRRADAENVLRLVEQLDPGPNTTGHAIIDAWNGDVEAAITRFQAAVRTPGMILVLRYAPQWEPLRKDPRFPTLLIVSSPSAQPTENKEAKK